jgi:hypothetical protein
MRLAPTREMLAQSWQKYGLIVVGNIVFFVLVYFVSYRPNNDEHRAAELLSMAQEQETQTRFEAAAVLYGKVLERYPATEAAATARGMIPAVRKRLATRGGDLGLRCAQPCLDVAAVLGMKPSLFVATYLAERYGEDPAAKPELRRAIARYLGAAIRVDGLSLADLKREPALRSAELDQELFSIRAACAMTSDLVYDDFAIRNDNFFPWTAVDLRIDVRQGDRAVTEKIRVDGVPPGASVDAAELDVKKGGGAVTCSVSVIAAEGRGAWSGAL